LGEAFTTKAGESGDAGVLAALLDPLLLLLQLQLLQQEELALLLALMLASLALDPGRLTADPGRLTTTPILAAISSGMPIAAAIRLTTCPLETNDTIKQNQLHFPFIIKIS
jgi:hypothetical protein